MERAVITWIVFLAFCWGGYAQSSLTESVDDSLSPRVFMADAGEVLLICRVYDRKTSRMIPSRVYLRNKEGQWFFPRSMATNGLHIPYRKQFGHNLHIQEQHTTFSPHPFAISLPPGLYTITVERGKEYRTYESQFVLTESMDTKRMDIPMDRWVNMADRGWYSGETHVHRDIEELPLLQKAEDLNVAFPFKYWVTQSHTAPTSGDRNMSGPKSGKEMPSGLVTVDKTHVFYTQNTEYEIFSVKDKKHTLGAFFILNHREPFLEGAPPVQPIAEKAHAEGALIELDKHAWEWSMMLVPIMKVDLFELSNNHIWRTEFGFRNWGAQPPAYMGLDPEGNEWAWIHYGFQNYYALLNCNFRLQPTAGTASGVHPVPLGFGRVYVKMDDAFSYEKWLAGLKAGRSFVTTGPMLFARVNGEDPGTVFAHATKDSFKARVSIECQSAHPLRRIEIVVNGKVVKEIQPENNKSGYRYETSLTERLDVPESSWIAVRCYETLQDGRPRFAHSAPWHIDVADQPLRPRKEEVDFLKARVSEQLERNKSVLSAAELEEYRQAINIYDSLSETAR